MTFRRFKSALVAFAAVLTAVAPAQAESVRVLVAASMSEVIGALADDYATRSPGSEIQAVHAGSGVLARQIQQGVPADLYISANTAWVTWLTDQDLGTQSRTIASNALVWIGTEPNPALTARTGSGRIALADPDAVPAGQYARQSLIHSGNWSDLEGRLILATNVRDALGWVVRGHAAHGIVYATDAIEYPDLQVDRIDSRSHDPITYEALVLTPRGADFAEYLLSDAAQEILSSYGFLPPPPTSE
ncbi:molybdate ABC transporter substrate-binding protein [Pontivivens nitratireducens]|uniref:Molybdate ABC transporter substrate-binding protein n=1 Tax=Pontivivens nitratireducens TaxID=2758038 RepID=A0A6G7VJW1_9RHOB|nr:molybdate ABC transporter substrate-binding protein [Pontibrevibacter nitratireducens]QIK40156.1 molybdate ABC transporter substrate-binding protein [Pontibrevibacter nitratireducens]